jgi:competence protein ComEC
MDDLVSGKVSAECYFLDVGQGTSNLLYLGGGRVIVIDGGPSRSSGVLLSLLHELGTRTIEAIIVSHNDKDHVDGACEILSTYRYRVRNLFFLIDRPISNIKIFTEARRLNDARGHQRPINLVRLERDNTRRILFEDARLDLSLELLYPDFGQNLAATAGSKPNSTSGVIKLFCGRRSVVFPGDAGIDVWRWINENEGVIPCNILAVPHHGGVIWNGRTSQVTLNELRWLYSQAVRCEIAVVSVGTSNGEGHPRIESIMAIRAMDSTNPPVVLCTQLTKQCCTNIKTIGNGLISPHPASLSFHDLLTGNHGSVACAGTVLAEIGPDRISVQRMSNHQTMVDSLSGSQGGHPLCRRA